MTNITDLYWEASGVSLHTEAWMITTFGGGRNASPARRGEDVTIPFRPGKRRSKKYRDSRVLPLPMVILPINPDGTRDETMNLEAKMHDNWEYVVSLMDVEDTFPLTKRMYRGGEIVVATAIAELPEPPEPTIEGGRRIVATFEVVLADPWFYGEAVTVPVGTLDVEGNAPTDHVTLTMGNGRVTNTRDQNYVQYNGTGTVIVDCHEAEAIKAGQYVNGLIERNPSFPEYMRLQPGENVMTGAGTVTYQPAYR